MCLNQKLNQTGRLLPTCRTEPNHQSIVVRIHQPSDQLDVRQSAGRVLLLCFANVKLECYVHNSTSTHKYSAGHHCGLLRLLYHPIRRYTQAFTQRIETLALTPLVDYCAKIESSYSISFQQLQYWNPSLWTNCTHL